MATKYIVNNITGQTIDGDLTVISDLNVNGTITGEYKQNVEDTTLNGTDTGTTAVLIYGINVVTASDTNDFCARLPLTPVKGKKVTVINTSNYKARIFPSVDGGKINGVVDGYFDVPADSLPYDFVCYENPNPGYWGTSQRPSNAVTTISTPEITVTHAGTGATHFWGVDMIGGGYYNGFGGFYNGNLVLQYPSIYASLNSPGTCVAVRAYSNVVVGDFNQSSWDDINITMGTVFLADFGGGISAFANSGNEGNFTKFGDAAVGTTAVAAGTLSSPPEIGDTGTLIVDLELLGTVASQQLGVNNINVSRSYYTFGVSIDQTLAAKDYKFRFEIDYI